jgi:hypothetical protein
MAQDTATLTHCPTCGVKLQRTDLSLCAYCASPLKMGASTAPPDDETARLLAKVAQHPGFAAALRWTPLEPQVELRAARVRSAGSVLLLIGGIGMVVRIARSQALGYAPVWSALAAGAVAIGFLLIAISARARKRARARPLLRRPARVLDRRSETALEQRTGSTIYFFQLRFLDGSEGVFRFPGRGTLYEPPTVGATGLAYTHGAELVEFKRF